MLPSQALARSLRLLLLAEQCRLLYRSLKLDQIRRAEPEALAGEISAAKRLLAENAAADHSDRVPGAGSPVPSCAACG